MNIWEKSYYACDCATELIMLSKDEDWINFAIFQYGVNRDSRFSWKQRIRHCWNVLRTGKPYGDCIILSYETAKQLGKDLIILSMEKNDEQKQK